MERIGRTIELKNLAARNHLGQSLALNLSVTRLPGKKWSISGSSAQGMGIERFTASTSLLNTIAVRDFSTDWTTLDDAKLDQPLDLDNLI